MLNETGVLVIIIISHSIIPVIAAIYGEDFFNFLQGRSK